MRPLYKIVITLVIIVIGSLNGIAQYNVEKELGSRSLGLLQFNFPAAVVSGADGSFYVSDQSTIYKLSNNGDLLKKWTSSNNQQILKLTLNKNNELIALSSFSKIIKLNSDLEVTQELGEYGPNDGQLQEVIDIASDENNNIYVFDRIYSAGNSQGIYRVQIFDSEGNFINKPIIIDRGYYNSIDDYNLQVLNNLAVGAGKIVVTGYNFGNNISSQGKLKIYSTSGTLENNIESLGSFVPQFNNPNSVSFDLEGHILISDYSRVLKLTSEGSYQSYFELPSQQFTYRLLLDISVEPDGNLLVVDQGSAKIIERVTNTGTSLAKIGEATGAGQFKQPTDVSKDSQGNIYVVDSQNSRVQKFDGNGNYLLEFGSQGAGISQFLALPRGIEIDKDNNVYVQEPNKILKFSPEGNFINSFKSNSGEDRPFEYIVDFKLDKDGNVFILNSNFNDIANIQKFSTSGDFIEKFGKWGDGIGDLRNVSSIAIGSSSEIYINDFSSSAGGYRIQTFDSIGLYKNTTPTGIYCQDMDVDGLGNLYGRTYDAILRIDQLGAHRVLYNSSPGSELINGGLFVEHSTQRILATAETTNSVIVLSCQLPNPSFNYNPGLVNEATSFIDNSINVSSNATYKWDFGDGNESNARGNVEHIYTEVRDYNSSLTIDQACISRFSKTVSLVKSIVSDSLAMIDFYNKLNGPNWVNKSNWLTGDFKTWSGLEFENERLVGIRFEQNNNMTGELPASIKMLDKLKYLVIANNSISGSFPEWVSVLTDLQEINLSNNQISGSVPPSITTLLHLNNLTLSGNNLEQLPDLSTIPSLQTLAIENNRLSFEDIEPNVNITGFSYTPQKNINVQLNAEAYLGGDLVISPSIGGSANLYQWYKDGNAIAGATSLVYSKTNSQDSDAGDYYLQVNNTIVSGLTINTTTITVTLATPPDNDGDGSNVLLDCNDNDATIFPGAPELCDAKDNNCDGIIDNGCSSPQLWGVATAGGPGKAGTIFSLYADGSNALQIQHAFQAELEQPQRGNLLELPDGSKIGTTPYGGGNKYGGIFRINPDGTFILLYSFSGLDGAYPHGSLILGNDGFLYGMTIMGGNQFLGNIFRIKSDGTDFATIHSFSYSDGSYPYSSLIQGQDGRLYGMTTGGGANGAGVIFKLELNGSDFIVLHNFNTTEDGGFPYGALIESTDGSLFGMTQQGGSDNYGTIFKVNSDGNNFRVLHNFNGTNGASPQGALLLANNDLLYGMTFSGGSENKGTIFKVDRNGDEFTLLHNFNYANGAHPAGAVIQASDGLLYGMTLQGGNSDYGTVFKINPDGSNHTVINNFSVSNGANPYGSLIQSTDSALYGMTQSGGSAVKGTVFKINLDGSNFNILHNFTSSNASAPIASLVKTKSGLIYGITLNGGDSNSGSIFKINSDGTGQSVVHNFNGTDGMFPYGSLIQATDGYLYGTTSNSGNFGFGTIYKIKEDGTDLSVIHHFTRNEGPTQTSLVQTTNGLLYGITTIGGANDNGTIFRINQDGSDYSLVYNFNEQSGGLPVGVMIQSSNGALYGMTSRGGRYGAGTIYKVNLDGSNYTVLYDFDQISGATPYGSLIAGPENKLYGMTSQGGLNNAGIVFSVNDDGTNYTVLHHFDGITGLNPNGSLMMYKNNLFGYTQYGGQNYSGVVFKYDLTSNTYTKLVDLSEYTGKLPQNGSLILVNPPDMNFPTQPAINISFNSVTNNSMTINFQPGNGEKRVVLMAEYSENLPQVNIMDGTELSGNSDFSNATEYQTGWKVLSAGTQSSINVTGLKGSVTYVVTVIEYNGATTETRYLNQNAPIASQTTLPDLLTPTIASSNITFNAVSYTSMQVSFTPGNGEQRIVVMNEGSAPTFIPADNITYSGELENGERIVYSGSGNAFQASGLNSNRTYYFTIFEFNSAEGQTKYLTSGAPVAYQNTKPEVFAPTIAASNITFTNVTPTSMQVNLTTGNGEQRLAIMKKGSAPTFIPSDDNFYSGSLNTTEMVVYSGPGKSFELFELEPGTVYYFKIFEFNTDSTQTRYLIAPAAENNRPTPELPNVYVISPVDGSIQNKVNNLSIKASKVDRAKKYTIQISTSNNFSEELITKTGSRNLKFPGLLYGARYYARVKTDMSPFFGKVTSFETAPAHEYTYVISPKNGERDLGTSVEVFANPLNSSNPRATAKLYTIELNTSPKFDGNSITKTSTQPMIEFTGLCHNTRYYVRVQTDISLGIWGKTTRFTTGNRTSANRISSDEELLEISESIEFEVSVLENPFKQYLTFTTTSKEVEDIDIKLTDMTGKTITNFIDKSNHEITIDKPMQPGLYILQIRTGTENKILRVVKIE